MGTLTDHAVENSGFVAGANAMVRSIKKEGIGRLGLRSEMAGYKNGPMRGLRTAREDGRKAA